MLRNLGIALSLRVKLDVYFELTFHHPSGYGTKPEAYLRKYSACG